MSTSSDPEGQAREFIGNALPYDYERARTSDALIGGDLWQSSRSRIESPARATSTGK